MDLDDLKDSWARAQENDSLRKEDFQQKLAAMTRSRAGIQRVFLMEVGAGLMIYAAFLGLMYWIGPEIETYMYKLVAVTFIGTLPVYLRLYKAVRWLNRLDYGQDIRTNLVAFLNYYKTTLGFYRWLSYGTTVAILLFFFTDRSFLSLSPILKLLIVAYMVVIVSLIGPYVRRVYGTKIKSFEEFLDN